MPVDLLDAVYGCLIAGAIGDSLGAPSENMHYTEIRDQFGRIEELLPYDKVAYSTGQPGVVTDDTTLSYYMCLTIVRKGGRITPDDAAATWLNDLNPDRFWSPDKISYLKMMAGVDPWEAGRGNIPSACATMSMIPIGIINAANPAQAYQDGYGIAGINGEGFNRTAPATLAAGIAAALAPDATVEGVLEAARTHCSPLVRRAIDLTLDLAAKSGEMTAFTEAFYERLIDWWSRPSRGWRSDHFVQGTSIETVPVALAILYLCQGDPNRCVVEGANFGRDADSIANLAGSLAGALRGASAIREDWVRQVEKANQPFFDEVGAEAAGGFRGMAERMVGALRAERDRARLRAALLDEMLQV